MSVIELMRTAHARRKAIERYDQLLARFSRMEVRFRALHQAIPAEDAHELVMLIERAQRAERDNPEPQ